RRLGCELYNAEAGAATCTCTCDPGRKLRAAGEAAVRGRPRVDRQGPHFARSGTRAEDRPRSYRTAGYPARLAQHWNCSVAHRRRRRQHGIPAWRDKGQMSSIVTISRLGAQADGIAETKGGQVFVPFTLPGENVNIAVAGRRADIVALLEPSPQLVAPPCRHFGDCGGCAIQHLEHGAYRDWKRQILVDALRARGIETEVDSMVDCPPHSRRRAALTARKTEKGLLLGFNAALSHRIVDMEECPVMLPSIVEKLDVLRQLGLLVAQTKDPFRFGVTQTASGLDIAAQESGRLEGQARQAAIEFCLANGIARLSVDGEIIVEPKKPMVMV